MLCLKFIIFRSPTFHNFIKVSLTKNPKKRPTADKLLMVCISKIFCLITMYKKKLALNTD